MKPNTRFFPLLYCSLLIGALPTSRSAHAEGGIVTDGTMGAVQNFAGSHVTIPQNTGTTVGSNLFHSFTDFNVNAGQVVTFTENASGSLSNIISRVTGDSSSGINGTLSVTPGGQANFYLINPNGVIFGPGAVLDVRGAFHASTADQLKFSDGGVLNAHAMQGSSWSSAEPASFGFLASTSGNNGLLQVNGAQLTVKDGQTLDFVAGKITTDNNAKLNAPGGEVRLVAMQGAGEVGLQKVDGVLPLPKAMPTETR